MKRFISLILLTTGALWGVACSSSKPDEALLQQLSSMDKATIFSKAEDLYAKEKYKQARKLYAFLYDSFPNDPLGHKAAVKVADCYFQYHDTANITEARLRYRDFVNRYPNDPDRAYALLMLGRTYTAKRLRPDRDLSSAHDALDSFQQLVNLYPNSKYVQEARKSIADVKEVLAEHEYEVAHFYARNKRWIATLWRLEYLKENYPDYPHMDQVDALQKQAQEAWDRIKEKIEKIREKEKKAKKD
ncbi:MAG: outer membrane protein assembly factor BamD [Acidobacteria bacterium]|nr:outer membrane protein assembly factor BamD [Acidobacteriota bacterium]